jgi:hypothetical protein
MTSAIMNARTRITRNAGLRQRALAKDKVGVSAIFDLIVDGRATDIAHDKDKLTGKAFWQEHVRATVSKRAAGSKKRR